MPRPGRVTTRRVSWLMIDDAFAKALEQQDTSVAAMLDGDPGPFINSWASDNDVTFFGAWGLPGDPSSRGTRQ